MEQGLAELVAYLSLASEDDSAVIDDTHNHLVDGRRGRTAASHHAVDSLRPAGGLNLRVQRLPVLIALMKGITSREDDAAVWQALLELQARVREYVAALGLELVIDESGGVWLPPSTCRCRRRAGTAKAGCASALGIFGQPAAGPVAQEARGVRCGWRRIAPHPEAEQIADMARLFLADTGNEAKLMDRVESDMKKIVEMGFLRRLRGSEDRFEVRRILKAFVDAQWLAEFEKRWASIRLTAGEAAVHPEPLLAEVESGAAVPGSGFSPARASKSSTGAPSTSRCGAWTRGATTRS